MTTSIPFTDVVASLPESTPFVGPEAIEREIGRVFDARIGANESAFGVSPKAAVAMQQSIASLSWYGDPENYDLRAALAELHGVSMDEICVGGGIDDLLGLVVRMTVSAGTPVVTSLGAYPTFNYHASGFGGRLETVPYANDREDADALLAKANACGAPLIYFANPDNPMGTWHGAEDVQAIIDRVPEGKLLVLDEAYVEFAPERTDPPIDTSDPRVIRMRTFSKAHGMAGARIGYAVAHKDIATALNKVRLHFAVNRVAQAGALASLSDLDHVRTVVAEVARGRQEYYDLAARLQLPYIRSATNFVAIDVGSGERARAVVAELARNGVFIRMPGAPGLDRCIRATVGTPEQRAVFAAALKSALENVPA